MKKVKNKKLKSNRILKICISSLIIFILLSVWYKLIFKQNDWLFISVVWGLAYGWGLLIKPFVYGGIYKDKMTNVFLFIGSMIVLPTIAAFISGVIIGSSRWFIYFCSAVVPYVISVLIGYDFYNPKVEEEDNNEISEVKII